MRFFSRMKGVVFAVLFLVVQTFLLGPEQPLRSSVTLLDGLVIFLSFLFFLGSLLGWGALIASKIQHNSLPARLLLGTIFLSFVAFFCAWTGFIGEGKNFLLLATLVAGYYFLPRQLKIKNAQLARAINAGVIITAAFAAALFSLVIKGTTLLNLFADVFSYHLYAPWQWQALGKMAFDPHYPHNYLASFWEALYLWGFVLLGSGGSRLFFVFQFSQQLHAFLGLGGAFFLCYSLLRKLKLENSWSLLACLYGLTVSPLFWTSWLAKNDYGAVLFFLGGLFFFLENGFFLAGLCLGFAIGIKFSAVFSILFVPLFFLWKLQNKKKLLFFYSAGFALALFPVLMRNYLGTGNPIFPILQDRIQPSLVSETMNNLSYNPLAAQSFESANYAGIIAQLFVLEPFLLVSLVCLLIFFFRKTETQVKIILAIGSISLLPAVFWLKQHVTEFLYIRYLAPTLVLANALPVALIGQLNLVQRSKFWNLFLLLCMSAVLFYSRPFVPWKELQPFGAKEDVYTRYLDYMAGSVCREWMTDHIDRNETILSVEDEVLYLLPFPKLQVAFHEPEVDHLFRTEPNFSKIVEWLKQKNYRFVYQNTLHSPDYHYRNSLDLYAWFSAHGPSIPFSGRDCLVIDLKKM